MRWWTLRWWTPLELSAWAPLRIGHAPAGQAQMPRLKTAVEEVIMREGEEEERRRKKEEDGGEAPQVKKEAGGEACGSVLTLLRSAAPSSGPEKQQQAGIQRDTGGSVYQMRPPPAVPGVQNDIISTVV